MSKTAVRARKNSNLLDRAKAYVKETRAEIGRVTWPTRDQALRLTGIVLAVTVALAVFLALVDYVFAWFISEILAFNVLALGVAAVGLVGLVVWWIASRRGR